MENVPEITYIKASEPGETPVGYVAMPIPFVGIYHSNLGADIDSEVEQTIEYCEDEARELRVHLGKIYEKISLFTADLLGIDGAIYAGAITPLYFNYVDIQPYLFVPEAYYKAFFGDTKEFHSFDDRMEFLNEKLRKVIDPWYLDEYGGIEGEYVGGAVYAMWAYHYSGTDYIYDAIEFVE